ncbi:hypothetical protein BJY52DRAFT_1193746 [Lactarius psammicola]|nr:hypothetical protein BJY52DRAFT_1193746 [Lactarius psammicola]
MVYFTDDSEQYVSWKKLQETRSKEAFTTEAAALGAQYEALRMWEEYVKNKGDIKGKQARDLVRTIAGAWITLQVEHRSNLGVSIDYKTAQMEAKQGALDALEDAST